MLGGLISGLIVARILVQFGVDDICIKVLQPFITQCALTTDHFYFVLGFLGLIGGLVADVLGYINKKEDKRRK